MSWIVLRYSIQHVTEMLKYTKINLSLLVANINKPIGHKNMHMREGEGSICTKPWPVPKPNQIVLWPKCD